MKRYYSFFCPDRKILLRLELKAKEPNLNTGSLIRFETLDNRNNEVYFKVKRAEFHRDKNELIFSIEEMNKGYSERVKKVVDKWMSPYKP